MIRYRAAWVVPISQPPIRDGWVDVEGGRVAGLGRVSQPAPDQNVDLGDVALMPGLVNAHTHLELSYLRETVRPAADFVSWIGDIMAARRRRSDPSAPEILQALDRAIDEAVATGTALVGDISNTLVTFAPLARSPLAAVVFYEVIRFKTSDAAAVAREATDRLQTLIPTDRVRPALAAHAPYSVAPEVFAALRSAADQEGYRPCSVHLSESVEELEFIAHGTGPCRSVLEAVGSWNPAWTPAGASPVEYLDRQGFLDSRVIAVHGVQMSTADLACLRARGTTLVTCPRSNGHTGAGIPPIERFYASGVRVAIGTDSLASVADLNMFAELAAVRALAPSVPASTLLDSATRQGARALGFESEFGVIEPGARARLLAVAIPPDTTDVEQWLVSGIQPDKLRWIP